MYQEVEVRVEIQSRAWKSSWQRGMFVHDIPYLGHVSAWHVFKRAGWLVWGAGVIWQCGGEQDPALLPPQLPFNACEDAEGLIRS